MKIDLSTEAINIIKSELERSDQKIFWELARLPSKLTDTDIYNYWKERQSVIRKALSELRRAI